MEGRYLTPSDDLAHRRVAVVGASVVKDLNLGDHPEGRFIQMYDQWFKVIGVLKSLGSFLGFDQDSSHLHPLRHRPQSAGRCDQP